MSTRTDELRMIDPVLTTVAQGYSNNNFIAEKLFPTVGVKKLKGQIPKFGKEAFIIRDTNRAVRADSNRIPPLDLELISYETKERDVEMAIDYLEEEESADFTRYETQVAKDLVDTLALGKEKEAADLVQDPSNYISQLKNEIQPAGAFDDYNNAVNPLEAIRAACSSVRSRIAKFPNTMVMGYSAYQTLINHPKILDNVEYSGLSKVNLKILSELTDIRNIYVGKAVESVDGNTFSDIWGDNIIIAYVDENERSKRSEFNPSFGYTIQRKNKPEIDTYYENGGKLKVIRNTDNYDLKITASDAAFLIYNINHNS